MRRRASAAMGLVIFLVWTTGAVSFSAETPRPDDPAAKIRLEISRRFLSGEALPEGIPPGADDSIRALLERVRFVQAGTDGTDRQKFALLDKISAVARELDPVNPRMPASAVVHCYEEHKQGDPLACTGPSATAVGRPRDLKIAAAATLGEAGAMTLALTEGNKAAPAAVLSPTSLPPGVVSRKLDLLSGLASEHGVLAPQRIGSLAPAVYKRMLDERASAFLAAHRDMPNEEKRAAIHKLQSELAQEIYGRPGSPMERYIQGQTDIDFAVEQNNMRSLAAAEVGLIPGVAALGTSIAIDPSSAVKGLLRGELSWRDASWLQRAEAIGDGFAMAWKPLGWAWNGAAKSTDWAVTRVARLGREAPAAERALTLEQRAAQVTTETEAAFKIADPEKRLAALGQIDETHSHFMREAERSIGELEAKKAAGAATPEQLQQLAGLQTQYEALRTSMEAMRLRFGQSKIGVFSQENNGKFTVLGRSPASDINAGVVAGGGTAPWFNHPTSRVVSIRLTQDMEFTQVLNEVDAEKGFFGSWFTFPETRQYSGRGQVVDRVALPDSNGVQVISRVTLPEGTILQMGIAGPVHDEHSWRTGQFYQRDGQWVGGGGHGGDLQFFLDAKANGVPYSGKLVTELRRVPIPKSHDEALLTISNDWRKACYGEGVRGPIACRDVYLRFRQMVSERGATASPLLQQDIPRFDEFFRNTYRAEYPHSPPLPEGPLQTHLGS